MKPLVENIISRQALRLNLLLLFLTLFPMVQQAQTRSKPLPRAEETGFNIYPNPNSGKFTVTIKDAELPFDLNVYNLIGEMIFHWESGSAGPATIEINLSRHPRGIYLVELDTEKANVIKKVVVDNEKHN